MATTVRCPNCDESFPVQDYEGPRVECPTCQTRFERPKGRGGAPTPEREPVRDMSTAAAPEAGTLPILLRGSLLQLFANALHLFALLMVIVLILREMDKSGGGPGSDRLSRFLALSLAVGLLGAWFLNVVAAAFWAMAPTRGVSRPLGVAVLCLSVMVLWRSSDILSVLTGAGMGRGGMFDDDRFERRFTPTYLLVTYYIDVARMIVFASYLAAVARETGRTAARVPAVILAIVTPVFLIGPIGLMMLAGLVDKVGSEAGMVLVLLMLAGALVSVIWTLVTVFQLRTGWQRLSRVSGED